MKVCDLHCDTLAALRAAPQSFAHNDLMIDLERLQRGGYLLQCFACFVDLRREEDPLQAVLEEIDLFERLLREHPVLLPVRTPADLDELAAGGRIGAMLTVEEGAVCRGNPAVLRTLYRLGARMMTLTWNYPNELANPNRLFEDGSCAPETERGLTPLGLQFLAEMERLHMVIDVSHLGDAGIRDVLRHTTRPFAASHSNARALCPHVRNLPDDLLRAMGERGCLVGLNYCPRFLDNTTPARSRVDDLVRQAHHLWQVGGEDLVALGSDFDGISGDLELAGAQDMPRLADALQKSGFTERQVEKIFHRNVTRFFRENL